VTFSEAIYDGESHVEEARGVLAESVEDVLALLRRREVPVLVDPEATSLPHVRPDALVDATMAKRNLGTTLALAPCVICLGPGFQAGVDCDAVVETNRGPHLGRVLWTGSAEADTGTPAAVRGATIERVLRAPTDGTLVALKSIGNIVEVGEEVARVDGQPVASELAGMVRGLARNGLWVRAGMKIGDIDPRLDPELCRLVSDKALAIAGGVLEAVLMRVQARE
jgi:xanthine dehydrogenase accessory factor